MLNTNSQAHDKRNKDDAVSTASSAERRQQQQQQQQQQLQPTATAQTTTAAARSGSGGGGGQVAANVKSDDKNAKTSARVLDPSGALCYNWSMVVSVAFLYNFWSLSYRFSFREIDSETMVAWFACDYTADLIYVLDIVVNYHTGYLEDGVLQRSLDKIGSHYRESTKFYLDCLCLLPLDVLYLSFGYNSILRCLRLVKIHKFWSCSDRTERHTNWPNVVRTFALVHYILVIFHWNACLFHMISKNKILDLETMYKINDNTCADILCEYLHAFYWSTLTLTLVGELPKPRTKGEYLYVTVELIFGLFLFATVLGHVANIVTNVSAARKEFQAKLDAVKTYLRMRRVSDELQNKVIRWFDYLWVSQKSSDEDRSVACLPDRLKAEIAIHVHLDTLKRVDIFQNTEAGFLCELVLRLKPVLFSPGDYVCRKNEVGHEMYIVSRGILEVVTDEGKSVVATLKAGSYFGEISVLNVGHAGNKRTASVRSVGYSDLFCLNKQDLWDVLKNYPNAESRIRARAEERLTKLDGNSAAQRGGGGGNGAQRGGASRRGARPSAGWPNEAGSGELLGAASHRRRVHSSGSRYALAASQSGACRAPPPPPSHRASELIDAMETGALDDASQELLEAGEANRLRSSTTQASRNDYLSAWCSRHAQSRRCRNYPDCLSVLSVGGRRSRRSLNNEPGWPAHTYADSLQDEDESSLPDEASSGENAAAKHDELHRRRPHRCQHTTRAHTAHKHHRHHHNHYRDPPVSESKDRLSQAPSSKLALNVSATSQQQQQQQPHTPAVAATHILHIPIQYGASTSERRIQMLQPVLQLADSNAISVSMGQLDAIAPSLDNNAQTNNVAAPVAQPNIHALDSTKNCDPNAHLANK